MNHIVPGLSLHSLKRQYRRINHPLVHGLTAGAAVLIISSLGLLYVWHAAHEAQLDAVRSELRQLARTAATLVDGDAHRAITSPAQAGSPEHLALLKPLVAFHKAASDIIYVYTAILDRGRIYYVLGTDYLYHVPGDTEPIDPIMTPHGTFDPTLRRALERQEVAVNEEPVKEPVRSYMSAYAPFFDHTGRFVGVVGVDMWVRDFDVRIGIIRRAGFAAFAAVTLLSILTAIVVVRLSRAAHRARLRDRAAQARLAGAKRLAESRAQSAQASAKAKGELLAVMSHEMRTPMSGVLGFANLLLDTPLNQEQREFAQIVRHSGDALLTVINDILDYSKIEAGRMTVERIEVPLQEICDGVRAILQSAALERGVAISVQFDPRLPRCLTGDPVRIRQVLLNLAGNAVKFTEGGSVLIAAEQIDSGHVKVSVADTGIGIPQDQMSTLFQQYAQGESSRTRRYGGTGLGLAISKTLVELMGGEIAAVSTQGAGSTFWFVLPLDAAAAATENIVTPAVSQQPALPAPATTPVDVSAKPELHEAVDVRAAVTASAAPENKARGTGQSHLLLVEDNFVNQRVALYMLGKLGYQVDVAVDGREALARLGKTRYDLVLMDCQMPEMDGFEATKLIRDLRSDVLDHQVPIIAMTANAFPEDRARSLASGMDDFMSKPVDQATLSAMLEKWLRPAPRVAGARA